MTRITLQFESIAEQKLREKAYLRGQTLEAYLQQLVAENAGIADAATAPDSAAESSEQWSIDWRAWAASHAALPAVADDSRDSIYASRDE